VRALIDSAPLLQVGKGKTASRDKMAIVQQFVALAVAEDAPIPRHALISWTLGTAAGGAIGSDGVIPAWAGYAARSVHSSIREIAHGFCAGEIRVW